MAIPVGSGSHWGFNDMEQLSMCSLTICIASVVKCLFTSLAHLKLWMSPHYWIMSSLFWMWSLYQICDLQVISLPVCCLALHFLSAISWSTKVFSFNEVKCIIFILFYGLCFWYCVWELFAQPRVITNVAYIFLYKFGSYSLVSNPYRNSVYGVW